MESLLDKDDNNDEDDDDDNKRCTFAWTSFYPSVKHLVQDK
jgi:hypothetical protein